MSLDLTTQTFTLYETTTAGGIALDICNGSCTGAFVPCSSGDCTVMLNRSVLDVDSKYWRKVIITFNFLIEMNFYIGMDNYHTNTNIASMSLTTANTKMLHFCRDNCNMVVKDLMIK